MEADYNDARMLLDYYDGAYGPTLRIDIQARDSLEWLKGVFVGLARREIQAIDLPQVEKVRAWPSVEQIVLLRDPAVRPGQGTLAKTVQGGKARFRWSGSSAYWSRCAGLVDGLLNARGPGHQYLTDEATDDALVELAFMEQRVPFASGPQSAGSGL